jgi:hypothetical protein
MWRVFGISVPLPVALHTVASQHISTLHNTSGTHILRYVPAQVKHHLFFHPASATNRVRSRVHDARRLFVISVLPRAAIVVTRAMFEKIFGTLKRCRDELISCASAPFQHRSHPQA